MYGADLVYLAYPTHKKYSSALIFTIFASLKTKFKSILFHSIFIYVIMVENQSS